MKFPGISTHVSLILLAYNQEGMVRAAAESCLLQDYQGALEIIFSDDRSTDDTYEVLRQVAERYEGPHSILVRRNETNLGFGAHINAAIAASNGELIVLAAGDDISYPQRVSSLVHAWLSVVQRPNLLTSDVEIMSLDGASGEIVRVAELNITPEQWIRRRPFALGAAHAFTRKMHETFGDLLPGVVYQDVVMSFRASLLGGGSKVYIPLVRYREGGVSKIKANIHSAADYSKWSLIQHSRLHAQYLQIHHDLITVGREDLWPGRLRRRFHNAKLVLDLHRCGTFGERLMAAFMCSHCWWWFRVKHLTFVTWPWLAAAVQRLQRKLKPGRP